MAFVYSVERAGGKLVWYTKLKNEHGKWIPQLLKGAKKEGQAQKLADELEAEQERLNKGLEPGKRFRGTFNELCEWAFKHHFGKMRSRQSDRSRINCHAGPESELGRLDVTLLSAEKFREYFDAYAESTTVRGGPPSPGAINRLRAMFSRVFSIAHERKIWPDLNPVLETPELEVPTLIPQTLTALEVGPVLDAISDYWRGCCAVGILAGLRKGEILALHKSDVDLERRVMYVQRSHEFVGTKGSNGKPEAVPIHEQLVGYLEPWLRTPGPLLFPNRNGEQRGRGVHMEHLVRGAMVRAGFCDWYDHKCRRKACGHTQRHVDAEPRRCPECGMKLWPVGHARNVTFHGTRHTNATLALKAGASIASVQKILRHKDPRLTINTYGHLTVGDLADDLNRVHLPGVAAPEQHVSGQGRRAENCERLDPNCIDALGKTPELVSPLSRGGFAEGPRDEVGFTNWHQNGWIYSVEPTGIEPVTYALRMPPGCAPLLRQASQDLVTLHDAESAGSTALLPFAPPPEALVSPVSGIRGVTRQAVRKAKTGGEAPETAGVSSPHRSSALLTVREVAERLRVSRDWVYREIAATKLGHVRAGSAIRVPLEVLDGYLRQYPGLRTASAAPAPASSAAPAARRRAR
jgi:integrase